MLLTDFCNRRTTRAPVNRSITEHAASTASTSQMRPSSPERGHEAHRLDERFFCAAPDHLAAIRPRLAHA
jgi:hypothetical protein